MRRILTVLSFLLVATLTARAQNSGTGNITAQSTDCTATNACIAVPINPGSTGSASFTITGTFSATLQFEGSGDNGTSWVALSVTPSNSTTTVTSATAAGTWRANVSGLTGVRIRCSTFSSGTAVATIRSTVASSALSTGSGGGSGTVSSGTTGQLSKYTAATTVGNSTVADFGSTPTTHHLVACEVASTTCTLTDSGITDASPTGTGAVVLATSPTLTTPALGTPSALVLTNATGLPAAQVPAVLLTSGTSRTTANGAEIVICTSTCTITPPATLTAGQQVCVQNDDNVSTVITLAASTNIQYEANARTSYGTANHTMTSGGAVKDQICMVAVSTTKYNVFSSVGTWTNN